MTAILAKVPRLIFDNGSLPIDSIEPPEVRPADPLEYPPTKFVYTGHVEVTLRILASDEEYARALFFGGGPFPCTLTDGGEPYPRPLRFHPSDMAMSYKRGGATGTMTGALLDMTTAGAPVPAEANEHYARQYALPALTPEQRAESAFWSDVSWDW